jgi:hypothetical protein
LIGCIHIAHILLIEYVKGAFMLFSKHCCLTGGPTTPTTPPNTGGTLSEDGATMATLLAATASDLLSGDPNTDAPWQEYNDAYQGFKIMYPVNWILTNNTLASSSGSHVAAQFCPTSPDLGNVSAQCQDNIGGKANDRILVIVHLNLTQFQFSGDNATMLVEQFMHQDMNKTSAASGWASYEVINRTVAMRNATDKRSGVQTRIVSVPAITIDYR